MRKITRRSFLAAAAACGAAAALTACGGSSSSTAAASTAASGASSAAAGTAAGGTLNVMLETEVQSLDPQVATDGTSFEVIADFTDGLMQMDSNGAAVEALAESYEYDRDTYGTDRHISWIDLLAWTAAHTGGKFGDDRTVCKCMEELEMEAEAGKKLEELTEDLEYFPYYREVYETVLGGMVGEYEIEEPDAQGRKVTQKRYGLKAFLSLIHI